MNDTRSRPSRREWLNQAARASVLGGLGLMAAGLLTRRADSCVRFTLPCRDCSLLAACQLPRAKENKQISTSKRAEQG